MTPNPPPSSTGRTSLVDQFGETRASFMRLFQAHKALLVAELHDILGQVTQIATLGGVALGIALMTGTLLYVGGFLFLGEWLFGSIGWGLAHGVLFGIGIIIVLVLGILGARARTAFGSLLLAAILMVLIAVGLGLNLGYNAVVNITPQLAPPFDSIGLVAAIAGALFFGVLFMLLIGRLGGVKGVVAGFFVGAIVGLLLGWLMAGAPWTWPPAVGFAITIGLIFWPIFEVALAWPGIDVEERFSRLQPSQSIEAANETKAWLEEQWRTRRPTLGKK